MIRFAAAWSLALGLTMPLAAGSEDAASQPTDPTSATTAQVVEAFRAYRTALEQGDSKTAMQQAERAAAVAAQVLGPTHPKTAVLEINLADLYLQQGRLDEAREAYARARETLRAQGSRSWFDLFAAETGLGHVAEKQAQPDVAVAHFTASLRLLDQNTDRNDPRRADLLLARAKVYEVLGRGQAALDDARRALSIRSAIDGESLETGELLMELAWMNLRLGDDARAETHASDAQKVLDATLEQDDPRRVSPQVAMARIYLARDDTARYRKALLRCARPVGSASGSPPIFAVLPEMTATDPGWVLVEFAITPEGTVTEAIVVQSEGPDAHQQSALDAIAKFHFCPAVANGELVADRGRYVFRFTQAPS